MVTAIILAGGVGSRVGADRPKQLKYLNHTLKLMLLRLFVTSLGRIILMT